ncbi:MAG TPA: hypothetical protein DDW31_01185 [candidate division Zixibacteria bacterium]|jgi:hypothetical protein|nr:hypothetical protein [candidate division Zixibacteria bacterium]
MEPVRFEKHKGRDILIVDVASGKDQAEGIAILERGEQVIKAQAPKSVLLVTNVGELRYDVNGVEAMKNYSNAITPYVRASTVLGVGGIKRVILRTITRLTGRNIMPFDDMERAKDWLAAQP